MWEKSNVNLSIKWGDINELTFTLPFKILDDETQTMKFNEHVDSVKERMLIKLVMDYYKEWFVIKDIEEVGEDADTFNVVAYSLGYELSFARFTEFKFEDSVNAHDALEYALQETNWEIGTIDGTIAQLYRTFDLNDTTALDVVNNIAEAFGARIVWDTENRKISLVDRKKLPQFKGFTINYGRFLRSITRKRTIDEMVTRLYVEGSDGLSIHAVNPTGQSYLEDFSYFMYPFERDENKNVIRSSYFMSDELCHAILDHQEAVKRNAPIINSLQDQLLNKQTELIMKESELTQLNLELQNIEQLLDIAKATGDQQLIDQRTQEKMQKESQIYAKQVEVQALKTDMANLVQQIEEKQAQISYESNLTPELMKELKNYIITRDFRDDRYVDAQELYQAALKHFEELRQPKTVIELTLDNFLNIIEEQYFWDKIDLGEQIKVKYQQMKIEYMATIVEINYNFENMEISLTIANTEKLLDETEWLQQIMSESKSATTLIENSKYKWDQIIQIKQEVIPLITNEWDANKRKIIAGANNCITIGSRGILVSTPDNPNEMLIIQSGILALTQDGGETWKTAVRPDGVIAERLIGKIIAGQNLIITNSSGTFKMDENGVEIEASKFVVRSGSGDNYIDKWIDTGRFIDELREDNIITVYEKALLREKWKEIQNQYNFLNEILNIYFEDGGSSNPDVVAYHQKYNALYDYLFVTPQSDGYPLLSQYSANKSTTIDKNIFDTKFDEYLNQVTLVQKAIQERALTLAQEAQQLADEAKQNVEEIMDDVVYKLEIHSSKGFTFKNGQIDTVLTAKVYRGSEDITATIPPTGFIWKKYDKDGVLDQTWTNQHVGVGNVITLTSQDVNQKAIITCDINIEK